MRGVPLELRRLAVVMFGDYRTIKSRQELLSWEELAGRLSRHVVLPTRHHGRLWSPALYNLDKVGPNKRGFLRRLAKNVKALSCLVIDIDTGVPLEELPPLLWQHEWLAHSTFRSTPEFPRYRIVLPLTADVPAKQWEAFWRVGTALFAPGHSDVKCVDPSRMYFLPARPKDGLPFVRHNRGRWLNPADWSADVLAWSGRSEAAAPPPPPAHTPTSPFEENALNVRRLLDWSVTRAVVGERNDVGVWLACKLRDNGVLAEGEAVMREYARRVVQTADDPYTEEHAVATWRCVCRKPPLDNGGFRR